MTPKKINAIKLLETDHRKVKKLLKQWSSTTERSSQRVKLLEEIEKELKIHTKIEEEIFYKAFRRASTTKKDTKMFFEAQEEHRLVDHVLAAIKKNDPSSDEFSAKAKVILDLVEHHAEEEETEMFPRARKLFNDDELNELGTTMLARKEVLKKKL